MLSRLVEAEVDPRPLGITRILVGVAAMLMAFDHHSLLHRIAGHDQLRVPSATWLPDPSPGVAKAVLVLLLAAGALLTAGILARGAAAACAVLAVVPMVLDHQAYSNHAVLLAALAAVLVLARPAEAFPAWRRPGAPRPVAYWPVFLLKTQVATLYGWAALAKVNRSYFSDETLRFATARWAGDLMPDSAFTVAAITILVVEAFLAVALWFRRTRLISYAVGLGLHAGLVLFGWAPIGLVPFALLTLAPYPLFLQDPVWGQGGVTSRPRRAAHVVHPRW